MSVAEIILELPKLTPEERATVRRRLSELEEQDGMMFVHESASSVVDTKSNSKTRNGVPVLPSRGEVITSKHVKKLQDEEAL